MPWHFQNRPLGINKIMQWSVIQCHHLFAAPRRSRPSPDFQLLKSEISRNRNVSIYHIKLEAEASIQSWGEAMKMMRRRREKTRGQRWFTCTYKRLTISQNHQIHTFQKFGLCSAVFRGWSWGAYQVTITCGGEKERERKRKSSGSNWRRSGGSAGRKKRISGLDWGRGTNQNWSGGPD